MTYLLPNRVYDLIKWVVTILLPAASVLYVALAGIWGWPYADEVSRTIAAIVAIVLTLSNALNQSMVDNATWVDESNYALEQIAPSANEPAMAYEQFVDTLISDSLSKPTGFIE